MIDPAAAAAAAPDASATPAANQQQPATPPTPIQNNGPEPKPQDQKPADGKTPDKKPSLRDTIRKADKAATAKAAEKADAAKKPADGKTDAKPADKAAGDEKPGKAADQPRDRGRFAAKDGQGQDQKPADAAQPGAQQQKTAFAEPPRRFKSDQSMTADWGNTPESVRGATHRAIKELEDGFARHKADADSFGELKELDALAKKNKTSIKQALTNYIGAEQAIRKDPIGGLEQVVANLGLKDKAGKAITFRDLAAYYMGQKPEQTASRQDAVIQSLRKELDTIKAQIGGIGKYVQGQQQAGLATHINGFIKDAKFPRVEELIDDIEFFLNSDKVAKDLPITEALQEAYKLAERMNPAAGDQAPPARAQTPDKAAVAQTDKGSKSITGAPSSGSDPAGAKPKSTSIRESLRRAVDSIA